MKIERGHLYLTGYRGSGKTSVGKLLGTQLRRAVIDLDDSIEADAGMSIREIFEREGEAGFRDRETQALASVSKKEPAVISLGGGAILREENRKLIAETGKCVWLKVDADTVAKRLKRDTSTTSRRPSLTSLPPREEIESLLATREPLYALASNLCVNAVGRSQRAIANDILKAIEEPSGYSKKSLS